MFSCKFSAYFLLLLLAINCKTTFEQYLSNTCLLRICTGNFSLYASSVSRGATPNVHNDDAAIVNDLVGLMPRSDSSFSCTSYSSFKYFRGIECNCSLEMNRVCRVTEIDFSNQGLSGSMPDDIGNLTYLTSLDLSGNELDGSIPKSFRRLTQLSYLDLCDNKLEGPVLSFFSEMKSLQNLYLCSNQFSGPIPRELGTLPSLKYLNIRFNTLSGSIPNEIWSISSLILLNLDNNQLIGQLPEELGGLSNLQEIYLMNNNFTGVLPLSIGKLTNLQTFNIQGNNFNGAIPQSIADLKALQTLWLMGNNFEGPLPRAVSAKSLNYLAITGLTGGRSYPFPEIQHMTNLRSLTLRDCSLTGPIPDFIWHLRYLSYLDLSFNSLTGGIPPSVDHLFGKIFLRRNQLNGSLPEWLINLNSTFVDVSENLFKEMTLPTGTISPNINLFACCSNVSNVDMKWQEADYYCANDTLTYDHLYINCGGNRTFINGSYYEADLQPNGESTFFLSENKAWAYSSMGTFMYADSNQYIVNKTCNISMADAPLYTGARVSPISLKYYGFCLRNDRYTVRLHFAEIGWDATTNSSIKRNRVFDVEIQGKKVLRDFNIEEAAGSVDKDFTKEFDVSVNDTRLQIHLYWSGKGSTSVPTKYYGPLISAISVSPVPKKHQKLSSGSIAGIIGSSLVLFVLILALFWKLGWLGGKRPKHDGVELYPGGVFNFHEIMAATNNFDTKNKIGEGGGTVYKGVLPDGVEIAVKQLSVQSKQRARTIINEIGTIYALQDPNIARPMGCCAEENQVLLVYKYMENISLQHALFGSEVGKSRLNWSTRVKICLGMAKGLAFLHEGSRLDIIHSNIKPSNILLDRDFNVKISDFGYAQLHDAQLHYQDTTSGNMPKAERKAHMAPEYMQGLPLTPKADVYSFGIVTLEIVSGQNIITYGPKNQNIYLLNLAYQYQLQQNLIALVDPSLGSNYKHNEALNILDLAMHCVSPSFDLRPKMSDAVKVLEGKTKLKTSSTNVPHPVPEFKMAEPLALISESSESGSTSLEGSSNTTTPHSASKGIDDSVIS